MFDSVLLRFLPFFSEENLSTRVGKPSEGPGDLPTRVGSISGSSGDLPTRVGNTSGGSGDRQHVLAAESGNVRFCTTLPDFHSKCLKFVGFCVPLPPEVK